MVVFHYSCLDMYGGIPLLTSGHVWWYSITHVWTCMVVFHYSCLDIYGGIPKLTSGHVWWYFNTHVWTCMVAMFSSAISQSWSRSKALRMSALAPSMSPFHCTSNMPRYTRATGLLGSALSSSLNSWSASANFSSSSRIWGTQRY